MWRSKDVFKSSKSKKAFIVETLREDAKRENNGQLGIQYYLPTLCTSSNVFVPCCAEAFTLLYGVSSKTRIFCARTVEAGECLTEKEESEMKTAIGEARRQQTLLWMKEVFELLCDILPTSDYQKKDYHLPKCVSKASIYEECRAVFKVKEAEYGEEYKPYSRPMFSKLWSLNFSYVTVPEHMAFSVCQICADLHSRILAATKACDRIAMIELQRLRRIHLSFISNERMAYRVNQNLARDEPDKYESLCIDGMDQAKLRGPHFAGGGLPKSAYNLKSKYFLNVFQHIEYVEL